MELVKECMSIFMTESLKDKGVDKKSINIFYQIFKR